MKDLVSKNEGVFGLDESWEFDYLWSVVKIGFWLWMVSGFQRLPTQDEVMKYDPRWITDMQLAYKIFSFFKNDSPLFQIMEEAGGHGEESMQNIKEGMSEAEWAAQNWQAFLEQIDKGNLEVG